MTQVFLSYSRKDLVFVEQLAADLKAAGMDIWYDLSGLTGGDHFANVIQFAIDASDKFIIVISPTSITSEWVAKEFLYASKKGKKIVPLFYKSCDLPLWLYGIHYIDVRRGKHKTNFGEILRALNVRADKTDTMEHDPCEGEYLVASVQKIHDLQNEFDDASLVISNVPLEQVPALISNLQHMRRAAANQETPDCLKMLKDYQLKHMNTVIETLVAFTSGADQQKLKNGIARARQMHDQYMLERTHLLDLPVDNKTSNKSDLGKSKHNWKNIDILIALVALILVTLFGLPPLLDQSENTPEPTWTLTPDFAVALTETAEFRDSIFTLVAEATQSPTPSSTSTAMITATLTPLLIEITDEFGIEMVLVPAGEFKIGNNFGNSEELPEHTVYLDDYYIDKYEVTNRSYKACVDAGKCDNPTHVRSNTQETFFGDSDFNNYPVIYVNWYMAKMYCDWRGARLPTEAEWEKAARGLEGMPYPWGEGIDCSKANYRGCLNDVAEVGSYEDGKSPYGLYDMAGNVSEWTSSLFRIYPYNSNDGREDLTQSGDRVMRGGAWGYADVGLLRVSSRRSFDPFQSSNDFGFRCARDVTP